MASSRKHSTTSARESLSSYEDSLKLLGATLRAYHGRGRLTLPNGSALSCTFMLVIKTKGTFHVTTSIRGTDSFPRAVAEGISLSGTTSIGLNVRCEGLVVRRTSWSSQSGATTVDFVGTKAVVSHRRTDQARRWKYALVNAFFQGVEMTQTGNRFHRDHVTLNLGDENVVLRYAEWYDHAKHLSEEGNYSIISAFLEAERKTPLPEEALRGFSWLASFATGGWAACPCREAFDMNGTLIQGEYTDVFQNRPLCSRVIPESTPWNPHLKKFIEGSITAFQGWEKEVKLSLSLGYYLESKATTFAELKFVLLAIAAETLGAAYSRSRRLKLRPREAFARLWMDQGLLMEKFELWDVRDTIVHTGTYQLRGVFRDKYFTALNQMERLYLRLLGYQGAYVNCAKGFTEEVLK